MGGEGRATAAWAGSCDYRGGRCGLPTIARQTARLTGQRNLRLSEANPQHFMVDTRPRRHHSARPRRRLAGRRRSLPGLAPAATAQFRVEISGIGATQLPVGVTKFRDEDKSGQSDLGHRARRPASAAGCSASSTASGDFDETARVPTTPSGAAAAPTRWWRARPRAWPTAASTCATSCGTWSRASDLGGQSAGRAAGRPAAGRAPHRRRDLREAHRRAGACSPPASPTSRERPTATRCTSPTPTAKAGRWR